MSPSSSREGLEDPQQTNGSSSSVAGAKSQQQQQASSSRLRESLLSVLGKLVVRGTRYRPTPTSSSSIPPGSPTATECFFGACDDSRSKILLLLEQHLTFIYS